MDQNVLYFFDGKPEALLLYEAFEEVRQQCRSCLKMKMSAWMY